MNGQKIASVLRSYPRSSWTRHWLATPAVEGGVCYCALGMLLRAAGISDEPLLAARSSPEALHNSFSETLYSEYGIEDYRVRDFLYANDSLVSSHLELADIVERGESALVEVVDASAG